MNKIHVFIIGARGYHYNYGGWETFVSQLVDHYNDPNTIFHISELAKINDHKKINNNIWVDYFKIANQGQTAMLIQTIKAFKYYVKKIKKEHISNAYIYILGLKLGPYLTLYQHTTRRLGIKVYVNPDGLEWKRSKWGYFTKKYFLHAEKTMLTKCDKIICDAKGIYDYLSTTYPSNRVPKRVIAYGSNEIAYPADEQSILDKYHLKTKDYLLIVGRLVPENNLDYIIKEYIKSSIPKTLVVVTNLSKEQFPEYAKKHHLPISDRINYLGPVYNSDEINTIRHHAWAYIHGHSVGGTNPSLLESLRMTNINIAYDVCFNKEVCGKAGVYFTLEEDSLKAILDDYLKLDKRSEELHAMAKKILQKKYTWDLVVAQYQEEFIGEYSGSNKNS